MQLVEIKALKIGYGDKTILQNANMTISSGDFIGIIGPNGGGKTTFIRALLGQIEPWGGRVEYASDLRIGYLPQTSTIDRQFPINVLEVVCSGGKAGAKLREKAMELLQQTGIDHLAKRGISRLSGGELQRVLLCRALINAPQLLVLDEPTTYVDNKFEKEFYQILHQLNQILAIVMVSHDLGMISQHVKSIVCINRNFHFHPSNIITSELLLHYDCPLQIVRHGEVPHTVLLKH